ncbi:MAG: VWA domain-containing protein [Anaeromyxobacter sp.]|nr:VWA domain-containing protein [Anaeromyxobacter sp.]MBL0274804.1 VWA domain-containing protein [Anaeromyxobacter sp.]
MLARLVEFARLLRQNGVRVSTAEVGDAAAAAALIGLSERAGLKAALAATLVKRSADQPAFEVLFDLHFSGLGRVLAAAEGSLVEALREAGLLSGDELEMVIRRLAAAAAGMGPLGRAAVAGDRGQLLRLLRAAALQLDFALLAGARGDFAVRRLTSAAGGDQLAEDEARARAALAGSGLDPGTLDALSGALREAFAGVEAAARAWAEWELLARSPPRAADALPGPGAPRPTQAELDRVAAAVRRLARRLQARLVRRDRSRRRGALALRRTLRRNLGLGGWPARLLFRRRRPERPDLVVLCDVSESMRPTTRLMLLFLSVLQAQARRVRTFVFVDELGEVTDLLRAAPDPARAADLAVAARVIPLSGNSAYGRVLRRFQRDHLDAVSRRTTVIVIGDGRTNYAPPEVWALEAIARKARRVLWICPEPRSRWGQGDSEMALYAARCERVATVERLADLEGLADALVPRR